MRVVARFMRMAEGYKYSDRKRKEEIMIEIQISRVK
jgi:hypothetical protein